MSTTPSPNFTTSSSHNISSSSNSPLPVPDISTNYTHSTSNYSLALSNISSSSSALRKFPVKSSSEYRALRQQLFKLQSVHNSLKLSHERDKILFSSQKSQLQEKVQKLQEQMDEIKKDQVFIYNSEQNALRDLENIKSEKEKHEKNFKSRLSELEQIISTEREARYTAESVSTNLKLKLQSQEHQTAPGYSEEFVSSLLCEWKERVMLLNSKNQTLEEELRIIKETKSRSSQQETELETSSSDNCESLRQKILSTYTSLESAQTSLLQKKSEIERLSNRIGNVKILEEKYRDAQIKIKKLETELSSKIHDNFNFENKNEKESVNLEDKNMNCSKSSLSTSSSSATDLKLIELTQELGSLKENLAVSHYNQSVLQQDLLNCNKNLETLQIDLEDSKRTVQKLQNSLKVKENTIVSLKEQLDSTVTLLNETLKKKK